MLQMGGGETIVVNLKSGIFIGEIIARNAPKI
jgi:hypothetical protein